MRTQDGNPDEKDGMLNFGKREKIYNAIEFLERYKSGEYPFARIEPESTFLSLVPFVAEEPLYALSLLREPRTADAAK